MDEGRLRAVYLASKDAGSSSELRLNRDHRLCEAIVSLESISWVSCSGSLHRISWLRPDLIHPAILSSHHRRFIFPSLEQVTKRRQPVERNQQPLERTRPLRRCVLRPCRVS